MRTDDGSRQIAHVFVDVVSIATPPPPDEHLDQVADQGVLALSRMLDLAAAPPVDEPATVRVDATHLITGALSAIGALIAAVSKTSGVDGDLLVAAWRDELDR